MKIGILTLPFRSNYGGILQAYALQKHLQEMGHETIHINRQYSAKSIFWHIKRMVKIVVIKRKYPTKKELLLFSQNTIKFINHYIQPITTPIHTERELKEIMKRYDLDAVIVGSDQVWRGKYAENLKYNFFLDFIQSSSIRRISYAASFGLDKLEFSKKQTAYISRLIKMFNSISVREYSGVSLCEKCFGVTAYHVLDPTLLLYPSDYVKLAKTSVKSQEVKDLLIYILDIEEDKEKLVKIVADKYGYSSYHANVNIRSSAKQCVAPPVENWIQGFYEAKFIITDSFHGCVFSILFNKPFLVYGNDVRGLGRITSLLQMFDLESRIVYSSKEFDDRSINPIDWGYVNNILEEKRHFSNTFLINALK